MDNSDVMKQINNLIQNGDFDIVLDYIDNIRTI